jgi:hypothetical protein
VAGQASLDEVLSEYDFSRARPNKYAARYTSPGKASEREVRLQGSVPLDDEAIFTLGFSDVKACHALITEMDGPIRRALATQHLGSAFRDGLPREPERDVRPLRASELGRRVEFRLNYTGVEPRTSAMSLFSMLLACFTMERTLCSDYEDRLKLDDGLVRMRDEFERYKEQLRRDLIVRYHVKPPKRKSLIHVPHLW